MSQYQDNVQHSPMTPPQFGGEIPEQPATWPTVVGVLLIVLACLGLLTNVCSGIAAVAMPTMSQLMPAAAQDDAMMKAQTDVASRYLIFQVANALILVVLGVLLLIAGIGLLRRRSGAVLKARLWAIARIAWSIPAVYVTYLMTNDMVTAMQQAAADSGQPVPAGMNTFMQAFGVIGAIIYLVMWCAVPVFVLIWFALPKVKEEVARWA